MYCQDVQKFRLDKYATMDIINKMRRKTMKILRNGLSMVLVTVLIFLPVTNVFAQQRGTEDAMRDARADAQAAANSALWLGAGCLFGIFGLAAAYLMVPSPPATYLMGKSPEYIVVYTDTYKSTAQSIQTKNAAMGCVVGCAINTVLYFVLYAAALDWE